MLWGMAKAKKTAAKKTVAKAPAAKRESSGVKLFEFQVAIMSGMITASFAKANPYLHRTIQIRGDQTLEDLHYAIFKAFDRFDQHMYEFQIGGKKPMDPKARRYGLSSLDRFDDEPQLAGDVVTTTIASLGLKKGDIFAYWFDFGDDWWHQIDVLAIHEKAPRGRFPKVTARKGASPPQYPDMDEDEDEDGEDEGDDD